MPEEGGEVENSKRRNQMAEIGKGEMTIQRLEEIMPREMRNGHCYYLKARVGKEVVEGRVDRNDPQTLNVLNKSDLARLDAFEASLGNDDLSLIVIRGPRGSGEKEIINIESIPSTKDQRITTGYRRQFTMNDELATVHIFRGGPPLAQELGRLMDIADNLPKVVMDRDDEIKGKLEQAQQGIGMGTRKETPIGKLARISNEARGAV